LTSQFPSTTPAQITTIHSGLPVGQHGIYEWFHYLPELDSIIAPLLFSFAGKRERDTLKSTNIDPKRIYPATTFYQELLKKDIASYTFVSAEYAHSPYSTVLFSGSEIMPYETFSELLATLTEHLFTNNKKSYYFVYFGNIDRMAHLYGPESAECEAEVDTFLTAMQRLFVDKVQGKLDNTLLLLTADHGQITIYPKQTIYLNKEFPQVEAWIKRNKNGQLLTPAGACRDMFLHIKSEYLDEAYAFLKEHLKGKAEVYFVKDLLKQGFFGKDISETFLSHVGDIVILSLNHESVWWYEKDKFEVVYNGYHGGLTKDEIEIPFAVLPFENI
jgi:predicted AlkP superfamily pyrophosphatase or phosphodiesterase